MPTYLSPQANMRSTYRVKAVFKDVNSNAVVPNSIKWSLTDHRGRIINNHNGTTVLAANLASTYYFVLSSSDLAMRSEEDTRRVLTVEATYTSTEGTSMPLKDEARFEVVDLVAVSS